MLRHLLIWSVLAALTMPGVLAAAERPNIVLIMADDKYEVGA